MSGVKGKKMIKSVLEDIPGVGPGRRAKLLEVFGTIDAIKSASLEELADKAGIPESVAENIRTFFEERK